VDRFRRYLPTTEQPIFRRAVIAAAFSPRLTAVLNEAFHFISLTGAEAVVVHVGLEDESTQRQLVESLEKSFFKDKIPEFVIEGGNAADALLRSARKVEADLIIAGALAKEALFRYYLGSVARSLARHAACSVLLLTDPQERPKSFTNIHCAVEFHQGCEKAVQVAADLSWVLRSRHLYFTHSFVATEYGVKKSNESAAEEIRTLYGLADEKLRAFLQANHLSDADYEMRSLVETSQMTTMSFSRDVQADLFIIHGPTDRFSLWNRMFAQDLEMTLQHLPCSLLLTR